MLFELWFQQQVIGVSHDNRAADCFETRNDLTWLRTRSSYVAQTDDLLDIAGCDSIEYSIEGNEVSVDIGDDGNRHENTPESLMYSSAIVTHCGVYCNRVGRRDYVSSLFCSLL